MLRNLVVLALVSAAVACGGSDATGGGGGGSAPEPTPQEVMEAKAGTYRGSWVLSGYQDGAATVAFEWTDVAVADGVVVEDARAYLSVTDTSTFTAGIAKGMVFEQTWLEGVLIEDDGAVGSQFIEMDGAVTLLEEVGENHFVYEQPVTSQDLLSIPGVTVDNMVEGHHEVDKVVSFPDGVETHDIHRTTSIVYVDAQGSEVTISFESLVGQHRKDDSSGG
ncbi:MAG: hypothetical protein KC731_39860 [Myxococcales bacterium]|nr:hypothetical protein [Myxococcales bacterium]